MNVYFLAVSENCSATAVTDLVDRIRRDGGRVLVVYPGAGLIGRGSWDLASSLAERPGVAVSLDTDGPVSAALAPRCAEGAQTAWNEMVPRLVAEQSPIASSPDVRPGSPLVGDAFIRPGAGAAVTGRMLGDVGVALFPVESNGQVDPSTENWTPSLWNTVNSEVSAGLAWWSSHAASHGRSVTFHLYPYAYNDAAMRTGYEPITRGSITEYEQCRWIGDIMGNLGYGDHSFCLSDVDEYNSDRQAQEGMDSFVSVFVVNSVNDYDGAFADGYFAFAYLGGPIVVMTYDNDGWGISAMDSVLAHELGHSFHACDEYYQPGYAVCGCICWENPWHTSNANCDDGCGMNVECLMREAAPTTCTHTRSQIGWDLPCTDRDHDGYGNPGSQGCSHPETDCNDQNANIHPGAAEVCNGVDDNCAAGIDEGGNGLCANGLFCDGQETCGGTQGCRPGTPVDCSHLSGPCQTGVCNEAQDQCSAQPRPDGTSCDDGLYCTDPDGCASGACTGPARDCDDGLFCTGAESCDDAADQCVSPGDPCGSDQVCDEEADLCRPVTPGDDDASDDDASDDDQVDDDDASDDDGGGDNGGGGDDGGCGCS